MNQYTVWKAFFPLLLCESDQALAQVAQRDCGISLLGNVKIFKTQLDVAALSNLLVDCSEQGVGPDGFQPQPICNFVKHECPCTFWLGPSNEERSKEQSPYVQ